MYFYRKNAWHSLLQYYTKLQGNYNKNVVISKLKMCILRESSGR